MAATQAPPATNVARRPLADRLEILELTSRLGLLADAREWSALATLFTDPVRVDYTSLFAGEPRTQSPEDAVSGWQQALDPLQATQHLISGHVIAIDGDTAACTTNVQATHVLPNRTGGALWTIGGRYDIALSRTTAGWRISAITLTVLWATGNQHILQLAQPADGSGA